MYSVSEDPNKSYQHFIVSGITLRGIQKDDLHFFLAERSQMVDADPDFYKRNLRPITYSMAVRQHCHIWGTDKPNEKMHYIHI